MTTLCLHSRRRVKGKAWVCFTEYKGTLTPKLNLMIESQEGDKLLDEKLRAGQHLYLSSSLLGAQGYRPPMCVIMFLSVTGWLLCPPPSGSYLGVHLPLVFMEYRRPSNANNLRKTSRRWISSDLEKRKTRNRSSSGWHACRGSKVFMVLAWDCLCPELLLTFSLSLPFSLFYHFLLVL